MTNPENRPVRADERDRLSVPLDEPYNVEPLQEIPKQEPLFNKKTMILWALGAFIVWFAVTRVVPIAKTAAREAIVQSVKEAEQRSGGKITIRRRNGEVISITSEPAPKAEAAKPATGAGSTATPAPAAPPSKPLTPTPPTPTKR